MRKSLLISLLMVGLMTILSGCASSGLTASGHATNIQLTNPNFRIVATNITGRGSSEALLGLSFGLGMGTTQLALIPINEDRLLYGTAMKTLWENFEATHGPVENRKLALVNMRFDTDALNLVVYTKITTVIVADVVEFE